MRHGDRRVGEDGGDGEGNAFRFIDSKTVCHNVSVSGVIFAFVLVFVAAAIVHFFFQLGPCTLYTQ